ncbi:hypothetical protein AQI95_07040 [Streptomyces yokosukanensis]|uniref:Uncharacterized protein n=1 Tax=Streptomyces yokosukanensis TaxID=67386 RepID=A0A117Q4I3_9ACTN|nr:hypothetical protein [Streptomyces yokosukanensis]KUN08759.1 hypothetical protein AQI95_07040 [Streptomyces yokosukanensis]
MSDFTGVDPHRVRLLANKLKDLAETLSREAPNIRRLFDEWGGTLNQTLLTQQVTQVHDDARDMAKRADEALNLLHGPRLVDPNDPHKDWINIPWDVSKINTSYEAQQEAQDLKQAMDNPKDPTSRQTIAEIAQSLSDHQDDPAYLQAFMANNGMDQASRAARVLHQQDGTHDGVVLSKESEGILAQFGQGVQTATSLAQAGKITLPPNYMDKLTKPDGGDMWSVGMLFKYGPDGDKWDPHVLSAVGGSMLDWRQKNEMRPDFMKADLYSAGGYVEDDNAWYKSLGLSVSYLNGNKGTDAKIAAVDANDPSIALMQRMSQNADASRLLLTGPDGADHAKALVSYKWATPGNGFDDAKFPAAVITAATSDRMGHAQQSAEAATNVINAGAAEYAAEQGRDDNKREQYPSLPGDLAHSLAQLFANYTPDLAYSTDGKNGDGAYPIQPQTDGTWMIHVGRDTMKSYFAEIMQNPTEGNNVVNAVNAQVALTTARGIDTEQAKAYLANLAELRGEVSVAGQKVGYDKAARTDAQHVQDIMWLNAVGGFIASVPTPSKIPFESVKTGLDYTKAAIWGGLPIASSAFSTNNAATVDDNAQTTVYDDYSQMRVSIMQGLVASGQVKPPADHPEWSGGTITFTNKQDQQDFEGWWTGATQKDPALENVFKTSMGSAYTLGTERFNSH